MRNQIHHFLLVCFPVQGHINPSLELARRLVNLGHHVTFVTTNVAIHRINNNNKNNNNYDNTKGSLSFATFSDGFDEPNLDSHRSITHYFSDLKHYGTQYLTNLIISNTTNEKSPPFTFIIYTLLLHWAADVATEFDIPSALLFVQPAALLALYYFYFQEQQEHQIHGIQLPGLPFFTTKDMPTFFSPSSPHAWIFPLFKEQLEFLLQKQSHPKKVLINTFDALEIQAMKAIDHELEIVPIGPLIPFHNIIDGKNCVIIEWLNSKPKSSVIYISFGSLCALSNQQEEEIVHALLESGYTFLWVMISKNDSDEKDGEMKKLLGEQGKIVGWCCQMEVLNHPSLGCFMTHCGWNSTIESLVSGCPMVAFPQQMDQATNAKMVEDVWKTGVRVKGNSQGVVGREEIKIRLTSL